MTTRRCPAAVACCVVLAVLPGFAAVAAADEDDLPSSARPLVPGPNAGAIDEPGDRDWYVLDGGRLAPAGVGLVTLGTDCGEAQLLKVELFNPEGRWMRTQVLSTTTGVEIPVPRFRGRYMLRVSAANASCTGLSYVVHFIDCAAATTAKCAFGRTTAECRKAASDRRLAIQQGIKGTSSQARRHRRLYNSATKTIRTKCRQ